MPVSFPRKSGQAFQRPEMFETWAPRFPRTNSTLAAAVDDLVTSYRSFVDNAQKTAMDETATPGARLVRNARAAKAKILPGVERLLKAAELAEADMAHFRAKAAEAYNPASKSYETVIRHDAIRKHFQSLSAQDRFKALEGARRSNDEDTLMAVASYQPFLSGLNPQLHQLARDTLIEAHAPDAAAALASLSEQQKFAMQFQATMLQSVADMIDLEKAEELSVAASVELA
jgi:hypothetical protein